MIPTFMPGQWVIFKINENEKFGQIKGGYVVSGKGWKYTVTNPTDPNSVQSVSESNITAVMQGDVWQQII